MKPALVSLLFLLMIGLASKAQTRSLFIDSLVINPSEPTSSDSILLEAHIILTYWTNGLTRYSDTIIYSDSQIIVSSCYVYGALPTEKAVIDSFYLKKLPAKTYHLTYYLHTPLYYEIDTISDCSKYPYYDSASINFAVSDLTAIIEEESASPLFLVIQPNPVCDFLDLHLRLATHSKIEIISLTGQSVFQSDDVRDEMKISTTQLAAGTYWLVLTDDKKRIVKQFTKQ